MHQIHNMMDVRFLLKKGSAVNLNEMLAQEFHKAKIRKIKRGKVYSRFKNNISAAYLAEMGSLSSFNHGVQQLLCVIDVLAKCAWVHPLVDKKAKTVLNGFVRIVNESKHKPNKFWVDKRQYFHNEFMEKQEDHIWRDVWNLIDCNGIQTHSHSVCK